MTKKEESRRLNRLEDHLWEIFHENSKISRYDTLLSAPVGPSDSASDIQPQCGMFHRAIALLRPPLETRTTSTESLGARSIELSATEFRLAHVSALLAAANGTMNLTGNGVASLVDSCDSDPNWPHPLSVFVYCVHVEGIDAGLYYYNWMSHELYLHTPGGLSDSLASALFRNSTAGPPEVLLFVGDNLTPTRLQHGNRGYRISLITAGAFAQTLANAASRLGFNSTGIAYYLDRDIDACLGLDGVSQSIILILSITVRHATPNMDLQQNAP
jgi:SagB-type dehydrogenase family enzyme